MGCRDRQLPRPLWLVDRPARAVLEIGVVVLRRHRGHPRRGGAQQPQAHARRPVLPAGPAQLCRKPAASARRDGSAGVLGRGQGEASPDLRPALRPGVAAGPGPHDHGHPARRPHRRLRPEHAETVVAMLATASVGAIWSSCSPDFGARGVIDRFGQIGPSVLFTADGYYYNGKAHDSLARVAEFLPELKTVERVIVFPYTRESPDLAALPEAVMLPDLIDPYPPRDIRFAELPFNHPLFIMFSSGTTGVPKCIVHGAGGTLLQHLKEHRLQSDIHQGDRVLYFTTCGWMMWNWLITALASEATLLLYDGSPFHPSGNILFDYAQAERCTFFGTSAKFVDACSKAGLRPIDTHDLSTLRTIASTGSPLVAESFDYVYDAIKKDVCLSSISGGTDIVSCFVLGVPIEPVWRGEIQARGLGMAVEVWDDDGHSRRGQKGELVCTLPFPSMPISFWDDEDDRKYRAAYFDKFPNVWCHGDYIELTEHDGVIVYGRSDATLNPGGVRIGTA